MPRQVTSHKGTNFTISDNPIHSGGEGAIHEVILGGSNMVAKIYHSAQKAQSFEKKILFMVNNPPFGNAPKEIRDAIIWPIDLLFENNVFVGYVMPMVDQGIKLFELTLPGSPGKNHGQQWNKFDFSNPDALQVRMKICYNLAKAIEVLHQSGNYVLVDLKPENVLIKPNGHFSIIDLDSIQITQQSRILFNATAFTPEYAPPEFHSGKLSFSKDTIATSYDYFSFAVILYQVLFSIHPFQASHKTYTTLDENIQHGMFVHGRKKKQLHVIPGVHKRFERLPENLKDLFVRALDHGAINPSFRPTPNEWAKVFLHEIQLFSQNKNSFYGSSVTATKNPQNAAKNNTATPKGKPISQPKAQSIRIPNPPAYATPIYGHAATQHSKNPAKRYAERAFLAIRHGFGKLLSGENLALKLFGIVFFVASVWVVFSMLPTLFGIAEPVPFSHAFEKQLNGMYYGFIEQAEGNRQSAYIQIIRMDDNNESLAIRIISNVDEGSSYEKIQIDETNGLIRSETLGSGIYEVDSRGTVKIMSTENNRKLWYFEK